MIRVSLLLLLIVSMISCKKEVKEVKTEVNVGQLKKNFIIKTLDSVELYAGSLQRITIASDYIKPRPVDVWLPSDYSNANTYSVLYMHDGQMLFDSTSTWNKQEWKVDDWATQLMNKGRTEDFIVVGIHNISEIRWFDLFPQKAFNYFEPKVRDSLLSEPLHTDERIALSGDNYLRFLVKELKPIIDAEYSVKTSKENTFVAGSSMGGLMSMYAISEYPEVFKGAACISTHWVGAAPKENNLLPDAIFKYMNDHFPEAGDHLVYFDYGNETLDQHYPQYAPRVDSILVSKGYNEKDYRNLFFEGTNHSENAWNKRLDYPFEFLLAK